MKINRTKKYVFFLGLLILPIKGAYAQPCDLYPQFTSELSFNPSTNEASINLYISNTGTDPSVTFKVAYFLSTNTTYESNDIPFADIDITPSMMALGGGGYYPTYTGCIVPAGNWYILVYVDFMKEVSETNENNNIISSTVINAGGSGGGGTTGINSLQGNLSFSVQNYPNPFHSISSFQFSIPESGPTTLKIYDAMGKEVGNVVNEELQAGVYNYDFDRKELTSGVYYYTLSSKGGNKMGKMIKLSF